MATKDWKLETDNEELNLMNFYKKSTKSIIAVWKDYGAWHFNVKINNRWNENDKPFKTKSQALKFAKSYMRTH